MLRFFIPIFVLGATATMVACSGRDPVANEVSNADGTAEVDVLPPDESMGTPTDELGNGAAEPINETAPGAPAGKIPASLRGRWGMTPGDCTSTRGDAKGVLVVAADSLKFYESLATPSANLKTSANSASGDFAFTGEGMTWKRYQVLELQDGKLVRTESNPMASYTYARCTS